jgi:hypothetical protein
MAKRLCFSVMILCFVCADAFTSETQPLLSPVEEKQYEGYGACGYVALEDNILEAFYLRANVHSISFSDADSLLDDLQKKLSEVRENIENLESSCFYRGKCDAIKSFWGSWRKSNLIQFLDIAVASVNHQIWAIVDVDHAMVASKEEKNSLFQENYRFFMENDYSDEGKVELAKDIKSSVLRTIVFLNKMCDFPICRHVKSELKKWLVEESLRPGFVDISL